MPAGGCVGGYATNTKSRGRLRSNVNPPLSSKVYGAQIVQVSGDRQAAGVGSKLADPVIVQVNSADGNAVAGAWYHFTAMDSC